MNSNLEAKHVISNKETSLRVESITFWEGELESSVWPMELTRLVALSCFSGF